MTAKTAFVPGFHGPEPFIINGGGGGGESAEFQQFLNRAGTLDTTHKDAFRALIDGWVADGNAWSQADLIYALKSDVSGNAHLNLKQSSFTLTPVNSPTFTANVGYVGGGSSYLDTGFNPTSGSPHYQQNSCSVFIYTTTTFSSGVAYGHTFGYKTSGNIDVQVYPHYSNDLFIWRGQSNTADSAASGAHKFWGFSRFGANIADVLAYIDAAFPSGSSGAASVSLTNDIFQILDCNSSGGGFVGNLALVWVGGGLVDLDNTGDVKKIRDRMVTFAAAF